MRRLAWLFCMLSIIFATSSCQTLDEDMDDSIPETSVFSPISAVRLAAISVREPLFASMYATMRLGGLHDDCDRLKAEHPSVTYRSLYELYKLGTSSHDECKRLRRQFKEEWERHPELHKLYSSASEYVGDKCADFASEVFAPEVSLLKDAFAEVWDSLLEAWRTVSDL